MVSFYLLTLKVDVSELRVTWATSVPILVFLGLSVLELRPDVRDRRQTDRRQTSGKSISLNASAHRGGHKKLEALDMENNKLKKNQLAGES